MYILYQTFIPNPYTKKDKNSSVIKIKDKHKNKHKNKKRKMFTRNKYIAKLNYIKEGCLGL